MGEPAPSTIMAETSGAKAAAGDGAETFVTFVIANQLFGVPVSRVQDILMPDRIAPVPLAPAAVKGSINLRGRIVTVVDVRTRLGLPPHDGTRTMGVTVEHKNDLYTLLVDRIGDVVGMPEERREEKPSTLDPCWRDITVGVYRLEDSLLVVLDTDRLLQLS